MSEGQILFNFVKISFFTSISSNTASIISSLSAIFSNCVTPIKLPNNLFFSSKLIRPKSTFR